MMRMMGLLLGLVAGLSMTVFAGEGQHRVTVPLPDKWRDASRIHLVLEGVTVPGNRPLKLRVTTIAGEHGTIVLGSAGIVAVRPTMVEPRRLSSLRIDVTRALKQVLEPGDRPEGLSIDIQAVDGRGNPLTDVEWFVEHVHLDAKKK